jgi:nucleoside-diphosphate-sugar epimerase
VTLKDILLKLGEKLDLVNLIQFGALPTPQTEPPLLVANVNRLQKELGWTPSYDLNSGLDKTIEWWKRQRVAS